jgi:Flp pilus assembly protein TadD
VLLAGAGAWLVLERAAAGRRAKAAQDVNEALAEATLLRGQARAGPVEDLAAWNMALQAARQAEQLLGPGEVPGELRRRVQDVVAELTRESEAAREAAAASDKDRRLVGELEDIRLRLAELTGGQLDFARADQDYAAAFRRYGLDVADRPPEETAAGIRARPIREKVAAALDHWAYVRQVAFKKDEAAGRRLLEVARLADPDPRRNRLRDAWERRDGKALLALAAEGDAPALPPSGWILMGHALDEMGDLPRAVQVLQQGQGEYPGDFWLNFDLAWFLHKSRPPRLEEAVRFYTAALALRPRTASVHNDLGVALQEKGQWDEAVGAFRKAIDLKPDYAGAHYNLGCTLWHNGQSDGAIVAFGQAIRFKADYLDACNNLGVALEDEGRLDEAVAAYQRAIRLRGDHPFAHYNLSFVLRRQGKFAEALDELKKGGREAEEWLGQGQRFIELEGRLPAVLRDRAGLSAKERNEFGAICLYKRLYAPSARFYEQAFAALPELADDLQAGNRYNAACAAVLAAAGRGEGASDLDEGTRAGLRRKALGWLRADLKRWAKHLDSATPQARAEARRKLGLWQRGPALADVRDEAALAQLPAGEQEDWRRLWADVRGRVDGLRK